MKRLFILFFAFFCTVSTFAQDTNFTIEITNVTANGGQIIMSIFTNAQEYRNEAPPVNFAIESAADVVTKEVTLPAGDYLIFAFQDTNNNQKLDFRLFGIPREPIGVSNYFGRGFPSRDFNRHKITIDSSTERVVFSLYRL